MYIIHSNTGIFLLAINIKADTVSYIICYFSRQLLPLTPKKKFLLFASLVLLTLYTPPTTRHYMAKTLLNIMLNGDFFYSFIFHT